MDKLYSSIIEELDKSVQSVFFTNTITGIFILLLLYLLISFSYTNSIYIAFSEFGLFVSHLSITQIFILIIITFFIGYFSTILYDLALLILQKIDSNNFILDNLTGSSYINKNNEDYKKELKKKFGENKDYYNLAYLYTKDGKNYVYDFYFRINRSLMGGMYMVFLVSFFIYCYTYNPIYFISTIILGICIYCLYKQKTSLTKVNIKNTYNSFYIKVLNENKNDYS
ncbi:hypothetical protein M1145_02025 [Patescibacteria group bacterium]|nr:hypothetical protein [Patescibacteria group bacterium]